MLKLFVLSLVTTAGILCFSEGYVYLQNINALELQSTSFQLLYKQMIWFDFGLGENPTFSSSPTIRLSQVTSL
jgi:hypothetical protein